MELDTVRIKMSEVDTLCSKIDALKLKYEMRLISDFEYLSKKLELDKKVEKLFAI